MDIGVDDSVDDVGGELGVEAAVVDADDVGLGTGVNVHGRAQRSQHVLAHIGVIEALGRVGSGALDAEEIGVVGEIEFLRDGEQEGVAL